ncbi:hypothetical protein [Streptomyces sp. NPDC096311]
MPETPRQPHLLLCASALDADLAREFADVIDKTGTQDQPRRRLVLCVT